MIDDLKATHPDRPGTVLHIDLAGYSVFEEAFTPRNDAGLAAASASRGR